MALSHTADELSFAPLQKELQNYSWESLRQDLTAGLSVAFVTLPQSMAYALLAGLPLSCGLFAAIYSAIIAALFGSSRHLIVGPSNAIALLIQAGTAEILFGYFRGLDVFERESAAVLIMTQITFVAAVLQILAAWCRLGRLTQFVSHSVIIGYVVGAALAVVINQLFVLLGIPRLPGVHSLYEQSTYLMMNLNHIQWPTLSIGIFCIVLLIALKRTNKRVPAAVITLAIAGLIIELLGMSSYSGSSWLANIYGEEFWPNVLVIGDTGKVYNELPQLDFPLFDLRFMSGILPVAFAIALLSVMETTSVAKSIASNSGQHLSINQEIFGLGLGNMVSAFIGAMPVSGSPSRSGLNYASGSQTRLSAIFNALFVCIAIFSLGFLVTRIPLAALAALLLVTAVSLINMRQVILCLKATNADAFVLWATILSCLLLSLDVAFYIGIALSITFYLKKAAIPMLVEYELDEAGELHQLDLSATHEPRAIRLIKVEGELFFGAADLFQTTLKTIAEDDISTRVLILQLKNARDIDATICLALLQLHDYLQGSNRFMIACGMTPQTWDILSNAGLVELIGKDNLFAFDERHPHQHMQKAFQRAKELLSSTELKAIPAEHSLLQTELDQTVLSET